MAKYLCRVVDLATNSEPDSQYATVHTAATTTAVRRVHVCAPAIRTPLNFDTTDPPNNPKQEQGPNTTNTDKQTNNKNKPDEASQPRLRKAPTWHRKRHH